MKAARLHRYDENIPQDSLTVEEIEEPKIEGPPDVIVRIGAAGLCRTDIHIIEGQQAPIQDPDRTLLPYTLGHENAGWVEEVGAGVTNVEFGDTVILHPLMTCGLCRAEARLLGQASFTATRLFEDLTLHPLSRARPILLVPWRNQVPYRGSLNIEVDQVPVFSGADRLTTAQM